ncbi:MAG: cytochrome c-type biogenesis protein [Granulosicoccaceae bacterium]
MVNPYRKTIIKPSILQLFAVLCVLLGLALNAQSAETVLKFENEGHAALYLRLTQEFRCLKCQNQNLAGSNADLAQDLRNEIYQAVVSGQGREEISDYLVARYGDFVLYRPPVKKITYLLWFGPFVLLLFAIIGGWRLISSKPAFTAAEPSEALEAARRRLNE